jgi:hypothetical protein
MLAAVAVSSGLWSPPAVAVPGTAPSCRGAVRSRRVWQVLRKAVQSEEGARWVELAHCHASPSVLLLLLSCRARFESQSSRMRIADLKGEK